MFQADPVVTWVDDEGPHAVDYYLSGYFQVRMVKGGGGNISLVIVLFEKVLGFLVISVEVVKGHAQMPWTEVVNVMTMQLYLEVERTMEFSGSHTRDLSQQVNWDMS